ncbi:hypothetical protein [Streptomyces chartreusis]|uniref:Uncharacterized protein n=1 Tax=Streptomyces chartreusis TaxID=1969 RepID=A0A7H8TBL8_STRCX|nr:hypothetical protein [Streptomyces chartreusis]QKZ20352.1 hypothetical protein HUT05_25170 [Streptomyces chartreusis]
MQPHSDLLDSINKALAWIESALWVGVGAGMIMVIWGLIRVTMGNSASDTQLIHRGRMTLGRGLVLSVGAGIVSGLLRWQASDSGDKPSTQQGPRTGGGVGEGLLRWGGIGLGVLALGALGGWGLWKLRGRRTTMRRRWAALVREHDAVATAYGDYLSDALEWLDRPTLNDVSVPQTAALVEALATADDARRSENVDRYQRSVVALSTAWKGADDQARKTGLRRLEPSERRSVEQARKLLTAALDSSGSEHERRGAYAKARALLDGVLVVPPKAIEVLETQHRLALAPKKA